MIDPLIVKTISLGFAALLLLSAWHKLTLPEQFRESVKNYQLLPEALVQPVSLLIPIVELTLGVAWLSGVKLELTACASVALLAIYALSMGINLLRGRIHIGCGCGMSTASAEQPLSVSLLARNVLLMALALLTVLPQTQRNLVGIDYLTMTLALLTTALLYIAASQLLTNRSAMTSWSRGHD
jgi:uncharacterized membrane protein YphA (DoxX/SURF4 family)